MGPSSESSKVLAKSAAVSASMPSGSRPSALARTGSNSTNHDLKIARASSSKVPHDFRDSSILSSKALNIAAIRLCSSI